MQVFHDYTEKHKPKWFSVPASSHLPASSNSHHHPCPNQEILKLIPTYTRWKVRNTNPTLNIQHPSPSLLAQPWPCICSQIVRIFYCSFLLCPHNCLIPAFSQILNTEKNWLIQSSIITWTGILYFIKYPEQYLPKQGPVYYILSKVLPTD